MGIQILFLTILLSTHICTADIFGKDDRYSAYTTHRMSAFGGSVAIGVLESLWSENKNGRLQLNAEKNALNLCKGERFRNNPAVYFPCTGFLISEDMLVTAGHCATNTGQEIHNQTDMYCQAYTWYFDFTENPNKTFNTHSISKNAVYKCKRIVYAINQESDQGLDYAIIQLDRPVKGRKPLKLKFDMSKITNRLFMLGHPLGLPLKLTINGRIIENQPELPFFKTDLDAFGGNSGSPVFNIKNEVVGILTGGVPSIGTYYDKKNQCYRHNHCNSKGRNCIRNPWTKTDGFPHNYSRVLKASAMDRSLIDLSRSTD